MRLLGSAVALVVSFPLSAWLIQVLMPESLLWLKLALATLLPLWLCYWLLAVGIENASKRNDQRRLLLCALTTATLMAVFLVPIFRYKVPLQRWVVELGLLAVAGAVFALFNKLPVHRSRDEVIALLEQALQSGGDSSWEEFVCERIAEPELEAVRLRCLEVNLESTGMFEYTLKSLIAELRRASV
jgi:hypothetical protein